MAVSKTTGFEFEGLVEQKKALERLLISDKKMKVKVHAIIKQVLQEARNSLSKQAGQVMQSDPRQAYRAVRNTVYRQILGGNVNIFQSRRAGQRVPQPDTKRERSQRTKDLQSYYGKDRGFILRWLNTGTDDRYAKSIDNHIFGNNKRQKGRKYKGGIGNRGSISPRYWFTNSAESIMERAAQNLSDRIDTLIEEQFNTK